MSTERIKNTLKITDTTFRDGHQSILATRMRTDDMANIVPEMNRAGFYSVEVWGGATFDVATRFLNEDSWDRPRILKKLMPDTPLQMLLSLWTLIHMLYLGCRKKPPNVLTGCFNIK